MGGVVEPRDQYLISNQLQALVQPRLKNRFRFQEPGNMRDSHRIASKAQGVDRVKRYAKIRCGHCLCLDLSAPGFEANRISWGYFDV
ncbi:MAG: hypothetical protein WDO73_01080 [Ignavibacteriota bacterium]